MGPGWSRSTGSWSSLGGTFGFGELRPPPAPGAQGRADASTLAGEGERAFLAAVAAPHASEAVRQDAAPQVPSEVLLNPRGDAPSYRICLLNSVAVGSKRRYAAPVSG